MGWDRTWRLSKSRLKLDRVKDAATKVARGYAGVAAEVEKDGEDILCTFLVPTNPGGDAAEDAEPADSEQPDSDLVANQLEIEISIYNLGGDGHVISLEADAADNHEVWEDACQLAEDLADRLEARELDL